MAEAMKEGGYCGREILQQAKAGDGGKMAWDSRMLEQSWGRGSILGGGAEVPDKHLRMDGQQWRHHLTCKDKGFAFLLIPPPNWACSGA